MEINEQSICRNSTEDDSVVGYNLNKSNNEVISKSVCDEQNIEKSQAENTFDSCNKVTVEFKKPLIIGPRKGKIGKIRQVIDSKHVSSLSSVSSIESLSLNQEEVDAVHIKNNSETETDKSTLKSIADENTIPDTKNIPIPYLEPSWSGKPEKEYKLEILKSGVILETIDLTKSFYVVGRLPSCDLILAHPTISRYHAIIQYRTVEDTNNSKGFYLYDLESTHGTFWNGHRIKPRIYVRLHGGHMIRFGCSQRKYILQAPLEDEEEESELTVTQLKEKRLEELHGREIREQLENEAAEEKRRTEENAGIDWGMGEDADEDTDLTENPYASTADEELYLDDPKKTLRGWFEREGYDLQYQVEEKGIGQFLCWINLPKECFDGRSIKAEALVKGKKKESVIQCALEACRILDKHGLLRQANHESRRRKTRNWEEEDYYDSDEDNFLDRTGTVERKREQRMKLAGKFEEKVETYTSLTEKHSVTMNKIFHLINRLKEAQGKNIKSKESSEDSLDAFMSSLNTVTLSKSDITKMKIELQNLRKEEARLIKLINLTKPANLPPLVSQVITEDETNNLCQKPNISTRKISQFEKKKKFLEKRNKGDFKKMVPLSTLNNSDIIINEEEEEEEEENNDNDNDIEDNVKVKEKNEIVKDTCSTYKMKYEKSVLDKDDVESQNNMKNDDTLICPSKIADLNMKTNQHENIEADVGNHKKRKRDKKSEKSLKSTKKYYDKYMHSEDYSTWIPPQDQSGDGRTSLNDKYGY